MRQRWSFGKWFSQPVWCNSVGSRVETRNYFSDHCVLQLCFKYSQPFPWHWFYFVYNFPFALLDLPTMHMLILLGAMFLFVLYRDESWAGCLCWVSYCEQTAWTGLLVCSLQLLAKCCEIFLSNLVSLSFPTHQPAHPYCTTASNQWEWRPTRTSSETHVASHHIFFLIWCSWYTQRKVLSTRYHMQDFTDAHDWLAMLWLTG